MESFKPGVNNLPTKTSESPKLSAAKWHFILMSFGMQWITPALFRRQLPNVYDPAFAPYTSALGTPVWDNVVLKDSPTMLFPLRIDSILIDAQLPKVIKKTRITGRQGTVKEYIGNGDWEINLRGALFGEIKDQYPPDLKKLVNLCQKGQALDIDSIYLNEYLKIYNVVVEELRLVQRQGQMQYQAFELRCSSDIPYELEGDALLSDVDNTYSYQ